MGTTAMPKYVQDIALLLFTEECRKEYFENFNFAHGECFKATLSKALGLLIITGSLIVKLPQVIKIYQSKSGEGINIISVLLDLFLITATAAYSLVKQFPFSSWGDAVCLALQTAVIGFLVIFYSDPFKATAFIGAYSAIVTAILLNLVPEHVLWYAQTMNIPILICSRMIQIYTNYANGSTGQLSAITCFMLFFGSLARIFTSIQETGDMAIIAMYMCSTLTNGLIIAQVFYYWNVADKKSTKAKKIK